VIAVEHSAGMQVGAQRLHHPAQIQWIDALLPDFQMTQRLGLSFNVILLSAVWMRFPPADRKSLE
jgi:hypothetical protein